MTSTPRFLLTLTAILLLFAAVVRALRGKSGTGLFWAEILGSATLAVCLIATEPVDR